MCKAKVILLISSFFEGFITDPFDALLFYYLRSNMLLPDFYAKAFYHLQFAIRYYSAMVFPTIVPKRIPVYLIVIATSTLCLVCLCSMMGIDYSLWQQRIYHENLLSSQSHHYALKRNDRLFRVDSSHESINKGYLWTIKMVAITALFTFQGARRVAIHHSIVQQFKLPLQNADYTYFRVYRSTILGLGKALGLWSSIFSASGGFYLRFDILFILLAAGNFLHCLTLSIGYPFIRVEQPINQGLFRFFKAIQQIFRKPRRAGAFTNEEREEIKTIFKVLPLFLPAAVIIAYRDQRFSEYLFQTEMLDPEIKGYVFHPIYLTVMFPLVKMMGTIAVDGFLMPFLKRKKQPLSTTTRSLAGFLFVTLSLAAATILHIRIEKTKRAHLDEDVTTVIIYNSLTCPIRLQLEEFVGPFYCPPISMTEIEIEGAASRPVRQAVVDSECHVDKSRLDTRIVLKSNSVQEYIIVPRGSKAIRMMELRERRFTSAFNFHSMIKVIFSSESDLNLTVKGNGLKGSADTFFFHVATNAYEFANLYIPPDRYFFAIYNCVLHDENIQYGAALTFLIASQHDGALPRTQMFVLTSPNSISMLYQIPQIVFLGMSDVMLESPTYLFASNTVPRKWWNVVSELWYFCGGTGNLITACFALISNVIRMVFVLLIGFALSWLSVLMVAQLYASVYTVDHEHVEKREVYKSL